MSSLIHIMKIIRVNPQSFQTSKERILHSTYKIKKRDGKSHNFSPQMVTCYEYLTTINIRNQRGGLYQDHIKVWCLRFYTCVPTRTVVNGYTTPLRIYKEIFFRN